MDKYPVIVSSRVGQILTGIVYASLFLTVVLVNDRL